MKESDVLLLEEPKLSLADQFYLPQVLKGLGTTMKHMLRVLGGTDRVVQYPEERREDVDPEHGGMLLQTYRGVHRLNKDEEGRPRCVACFMCSTACPARCIHIEAAESPWDDREKYPKKFDMDGLGCISGGRCGEAGPCSATGRAPQCASAGRTRQEMIFDKSKLLKIYDETVKDE